MASLTQWTWVWASSRSWWWTGKTDMLQSMWSQIIRHDWATELNWMIIQNNNKSTKQSKFVWVLNKWCKCLMYIVHLVIVYCLGYSTWSEKINFLFLIYMSTSALLTMPKTLTVWTTTNSGKFLKRKEYQTTWPASWEICMQVRKHQLELDMEQQTGSKLGKGYVRAVYCHPAYLTYMQSTSWETLGWMRHKPESRLPQ